MPNKWFFEIETARNNYIWQLAKDMPTADIWLAEINDNDHSSYFSFSSPHLNHIESPEEAYQQANKLVQLLNGISYVLYEDKAGYTYIVLGDISNNRNQFFEVENKFGSGVFDVDFAINETEPLRTHFVVSDLIHLMKTDDQLLHLFFILGQKPVDYRVLYQAYDSLKSYLGGEDEVKKLIDESRLKSFTSTANNYSLIGVKSRHGATKASKAIKTPTMPLAQAHLLIDELIRKWLSQKGINLPVVESPKVNAEDLFGD